MLKWQLALGKCIEPSPNIGLCVRRNNQHERKGYDFFCVWSLWAMKNKCDSAKTKKKNEKGEQTDKPHWQRILIYLEIIVWFESIVVALPYTHNRWEQLHIFSDCRWCRCWCCHFLYAIDLNWLKINQNENNSKNVFDRERERDERRCKHIHAHENKNKTIKNRVICCGKMWINENQSQSFKCNRKF